MGRFFAGKVFNHNAKCQSNFPAVLRHAILSVAVTLIPVRLRRLEPIPEP
jgi:hypothetical protein